MHCISELPSQSLPDIFSEDEKTKTKYWENANRNYRQLKIHRQVSVNLQHRFLNSMPEFIILNKPKHSITVFHNELGYQESPESFKEIPFNNPAHRETS